MFAIGMASCQFNNTDRYSDVTSTLRNGSESLGDYEYAVVYDSETASFIELRVQRLMEDQGLTLIGEAEARKDQRVLAVRYSLERGIKRTPGVTAAGPRWSLTLTLEDFLTDKTMVTCFGESMSEGMASRSTREVQEDCWNQVQQELEEVFKRYR